MTSQTNNSYIDDGYNRDDGYIAASKANEAGARLYDALSFSYRVATRREWVTLDHKIEKVMRDDSADPMAVETLAAEFVAAHLQSWDLKKRGIHPVKITTDNVLNMHVVLFNRLYQIIRGNQLSDVKPDTPKPDEPPPSDEDLLGNSERVSGSDSGTQE